VIWWAGTWGSENSPLTRLLFSRDHEGNVEWIGEETPSDKQAFARFEEVADGAPEAVSVEWSRIDGIPSWGVPANVPDDLRVARFERRIDSVWRRTSYTAITAAAHDARVTSEPEDSGVQDEPAGPLEVADDPAPLPPAPAEEVPLAAMAAGTRVGTLVHRALEQVDFSAGDLGEELAGALAAAGGIAGAAALECDPRVAADGLAQALGTPLGGSLGVLRLTGVRPQDRLDELEFELPLAGGDRPSGAVGLSAIATLLEQLLPADDPLAGYAERLRDPTLAGVLRGYLTGTIDLVLRVRDTAGRQRYSVIDYKTNWLGAVGEPLTTWHYRPQALAREMQHFHYALQALLYVVALHRYLRWRMPGYDPETDLLGIHYLFLRGMVGSADGSGVFWWRPPGALIAALSDLLAGEAVR
jgi:exodeoxyribonuclease V beta subunit